MVEKTIQDQAQFIAALKKSPVHNLKPIHEEPEWISIDDIDTDMTNPGSVTESKRYQRRAPSIRDSYDIFGSIIYPIVVCQNPEHMGRYIHVDGFGRLEEVKARGAKKVCAIVFPPMTLEQRICFRQTLNAAQEPFDAVSIIQDLRTLAVERKLDINNAEHIKTLIRDLPEKVQKHQRDILELSRWDSEAVKSLGESYGQSPSSIGMDQVRSLGRIMTELLTRHPVTLEKLGGLKEFSKRLTNMYFDRRFAENGRSQQGIRAIVRCLKTLPPDDKIIFKFFNNGMTISELEDAVNANTPNEEGEVLASCTAFINVLVGLNTGLLTTDEKHALQRTTVVLNSILSEVSA